jgi:exosortase
MKRWFSQGSLLVTSVTLASCPFACLVVAVLELIERHPAYHFFPLPLAVMLWLAFQNRRLADSPPAPRLLLGRSPLLYLAHLAVAAAAFLLGSPFLCGLAFWLAVLWFVRAFDFGGSSREAGLRFLPVLALFVIPPPMALDFKLQDALAHITAQLSHPWLDLLGVFHAREGVIFVTPSKRFFVDDACSGSNSFLTMSCMAVSASALFGCTGFHALLSTVTSMLGSVAVNMSRIVLVVYAQGWGWELEKGRSHDLLGIAMFLGGMAVVLSSHFAWAFVLHRSALRDTASGPAPALVPPRLGPVGALSLALCVVAAPVVAAAVTLRARPLYLSVWRGQKAAMEEIPDLNLPSPPVIGAWQRESEKPTQDEVVGAIGVRNLVWRYRWAERMGYIGTNYPFTGFHDTRVCYRNSGWEIRGSQDLQTLESSSPNLRLLEMHHTGSLRQATLGLMLLSLDGRVLPFPEDDDSTAAGQRLSRRFLGSVQDSANAPKETTIVLQFLLPVSAGGSDDSAQITEVLNSLASDIAGHLRRTRPASPR